MVAKRQSKRNPLRNVHAMLRLNPYAAVVKAAALGDEKKAIELKAARAEKAKVCGRHNRAARDGMCEAPHPVAG